MKSKTHNVIVLNWNESHISVESVKILLEEGHDVIVVDNGSDDASEKEFSKFGTKIKFIRSNENYGSSIARNAGIQFIEHPYTFLIDGDILYVRGTIEEYAKVLDDFPDAGCIGYLDIDTRTSNAWMHGTQNIKKADSYMSRISRIGEWYPMSWTQYGLFRSEVLKKYMFVDIPPFNQSGYGFEDDWLYRRMKADGWRSLHVDKPLYYHDAHYSLKTMDAKKQSNMIEERRKVFHKHWGIHTTSGELVNSLKRKYFEYKSKKI